MHECPSGHLCNKAIEYHELIGVDHFRLYNNDSTDNFHKVLGPYIKRGEVNLIHCPSSPSDLTGKPFRWSRTTQWGAIKDSIENLKGVSRWVAIIDIDEFFVPSKVDDMVNFLKDYDDYAGVLVNYQCFGTSGLAKIAKNCLMIESLTRKCAVDHWKNHQIKSIVRPEYVDTNSYIQTPHFFRYLPEHFCVAPDKKNILISITLGDYILSVPPVRVRDIFLE